MAIQPEASQWEAGIFQIETNTPALGGPGGAVNLPLLQLANRTQYLKGQVDGFRSGADVVAFAVDKDGLNQTIGTSTYTTLTWAAPDAAHDTASGFSGSGYTVPAGAAGWWLVNVAVMCQPSVLTEGGLRVLILVNGVVRAEVCHRFAGNTTNSSEVCWEGPLSAGDVVTAQAWHDVGSSQPVLGNAAYTRFSGHLVR
jgi:hypothetical protein